MTTITSPHAMQRRALALRREGKRIVFVPTMGALHEGHLALVRRARKLGDVVVMSIYVNPAQFGPKEDFRRYPRPFARDARLARSAGVDLLFHPRSLYAPDASTFVEETVLSHGRCGDRRPGHFRGVCTVVAKLFLLVQPEVAVFGQKDAQQCEVIERMVRDLCLPVRIVRVATLREPDGLAMSSRNAYLGTEERRLAAGFPRALKEAARGARSARDAEQRALRLLARTPGLRPDYVTWSGGRLCAAVYCGKTRLIDNVACPLGL